MDLLSCGIGIAIGIIICVTVALIFKPKDCGILEVLKDRYDDTPYFFLHLDVIPQIVAKQKKVVFRVRDDK